MAGIQFENEEEFARPASYGSEPRGMVALVMKWGLAKNEKTAQYVLLGGAVCMLIIALALPFLLDGSGQKPGHLPSDAYTNIPTAPIR